MKNNREWLIALLVLLAVAAMIAVVIALSAGITKGIWESDLPEWLKVMLLRR